MAVTSTPPKINIEPENDGLEDDFPLPRVFHVNLPGWKPSTTDMFTAKGGSIPKHTPAEVHVHSRSRWMNPSVLGFLRVPGCSRGGSVPGESPKDS